MYDTDPRWGFEYDSTWDTEEYLNVEARSIASRMLRDARKSLAYRFV